MAGTITLSLQPQFDRNGHLLSGGKLQTCQAGTTSTPQIAYQDLALTIPYPEPITLESDGRIPQLYFADGYIKIILIDRHGTDVLTQDFIPVIGASEGAGSSPSVDPTTVLATGDFKAAYGTGVVSGFVRANGRTIGSATSGASERANADCQALFLFLYAANANLSVSGGRGVSASADWTANKTIALPDCRGRSLAGLDDMGNSAAGRLTSTYFGTAATVLGAAGGVEGRPILTANLPAYTPAGTVATTLTGASQLAVSNGVVDKANGSGATDIVRVVSLSTPTAGSTFSGTPQGGTSTPFAVASPMLLITIYQKL